MKNILITGAGALLGQGILRCLNLSKTKHRIISADPDIRSTGHALADKSYKIPFAKELDYLERVEEIIVKENIDLIFVGTDPELLVFSKHQTYLESKYGLKVIVSNSNVINIANDKWLTAEFLKANNFPYPLSALTIDPDRISLLKRSANYPLIAKPVDGARSKGIEVIMNEEDLVRVCSYKNNLVVQEMLDDDQGEFTTGCVVIEGRCLAIVSLVRDLRDGNTWRTYRNENTSIYDQQISMIAEKLGVEGPVNFQYRIKDGRPVIFEINCRFSGTTPIRLIYGFNEVEAIANYYLFKKEIVQPQLRSGVVLKTFSDIFIENEILADFDRNGFTNNFQTEYYSFKK